MKRKIKQSISALLMASVLLLNTCPNVVSAAKIKLNKSSLTLTVGTSYTLKLKGTSKKAKWKSSKKAVATVSKKGKITAKKRGTTTITATVSNKKYYCKVTVKADGTVQATIQPSTTPTIIVPTQTPNTQATIQPSTTPTIIVPTQTPNAQATNHPIAIPTVAPTDKPMVHTTNTPAVTPTNKPIIQATNTPTATPIISVTQVPAEEAVTGIKCYNVQDTNLNTKDKTGGKGDASIVDCGNKEYVMIDCGSKTDYEHLRKRILATCDKSYRTEYEGPKVYIPLLIISHNHNDHMGAIAPTLKEKTDTNADFTNKYLLHDSEIFVKEIVYTLVGPNDNCNTVKNAGATVMTKLVSKAQYDKADEDTKRNYQYKITRTINHTDITIYGPAKKFGNHATEELDANNSSILVKIEGSIKALFLGDLCYDGLKKAIDTYGTELFSADFDFCKFGHHGYRTGTYCKKDGTLLNGPNSENEGTFSKEITLYNQYVNAKGYVFTASEERLDGTYTNDADLTYNYLCLRKNLKRTDSVVNRTNKIETVTSTPKFYLGYATTGTWSSTGADN